MKRNQSKQDRENRRMVIVATVISMAVIVGLWVALLPGQLELNSRRLQGSSLWGQLRSDGQETIDNWRETSGLIGDSISNVVEEGEAGMRTVEIQEIISENKEEIMGFSKKLEQTAIEQADTTLP